MKTRKIYLIIVAVSMIAITSFGQSKIDLNIFKSLPQNLELKDEPQEYLVITDYFNGDIFGNFYNKTRVKGEYTRGLANGKVKWNNVTVATSSQKDADFPEGARLNYMENFTYKPTGEMIKPESFNGFPENSIYAKNLVWDMMGMESFAWAFWDSLKINQPYSAVAYNGKVDLAGQGFFENKNIVITWIGISERNGELCATIEYRTLNNPLEVTAEAMKMKGRSHYWGTIWVSLEDKQLEHAELYEDVAMETNLPGNDGKQIVDAVREIQFIKLPDNK